MKTSPAVENALEDGVEKSIDMVDLADSLRDLGVAIAF